MSKKTNVINESYFRLVREFPLVPIRTARGYQRALAFLRPLMIRDENRLDPGEQAYVDALAHFVGDYEDRHFRSELGQLDAVDKKAAKKRKAS